MVGSSLVLKFSLECKEEHKLVRAQQPANAHTLKSCVFCSEKVSIDFFEKNNSKEKMQARDHARGSYMSMKKLVRELNFCFLYGRLLDCVGGCRLSTLSSRERGEVQGFVRIHILLSAHLA